MLYMEFLLPVLLISFDKLLMLIKNKKVMIVKGSSRVVMFFL